MSRLPLIALFAALLLSPARSFALDPEEAGKINAEIADKEASIKAEYGGRSVKEMSREERKEMNEKLRAARGEVLEKHGTSEKDYSRGMLKLGRDGLKEAQEAQKAQAAKIEEAKKAEQAKKAEGPKQVKVQRGFGNNDPVVLEQDGVQVQRGGGRNGIEIPVPSGGEGGAAK